MTVAFLLGLARLAAILSGITLECVPMSAYEPPMRMAGEKDRK
jgi:hypothetical protein